MAALGAQERDGAPGNVLEREREVLVEELVREGQCVRILEERVGLVKVAEAVCVDAGGDGRPGAREAQFVVAEGLAVSVWCGNVQRGVATKREGHDLVAGVGDGEALKHALAVDRVGHVETEGIRVGVQGLWRALKFEGHGVFGLLDDSVIVVPCQAVAAKVNLTGSALGEVVAQATHDGEEDGSPSRPEAFVALPEVLVAIELEAHELGAL